MNVNRRRRAVLVATSVAALGLPSVARGQKKASLIGLLWTDSVKPSPYIAVLLDTLRQRGWVSGRDFRVEDRVTLEGYGGYADSVAALLQAKVDLVVALGATAVFTIAKATQQIPIVMVMGTDPVATGLVASMARPGGNVTGVLTLSRELNAKRIELLKEMIPALSSVGVVLVPNVGNPLNIQECEAAARALKLQIHFTEVRAPQDVGAAIAELAKKRVGAVYIAPTTMLAAHAPKVVEAIGQHRIPAVYTHERFFEAGGLTTYATSVNSAFVRAAGYVERILKGARPGELAIETVSNLELKLNLKTAKALGIKVPQTILARADRVIE